MLPRGKKEKKGPPCPRCFREVAYGALLLKVALPCDTPYNTPSMTKKSRGRGGRSKIGGLRYNPPHQTNKGSHHAQDPHSRGHLPPRRAVHSRPSTPQNHPRTETPSTPKPSSAPARPLQLTQQASYRQLLFGLAPPLLPTPRPARLGHLALSPPDPSRSPLARAAHWARRATVLDRHTTCHAPRSRWCWWRARPGGSIHLIMLRTVGGRRDGRCAAWERGRMGLLAGWWGVAGGSVVGGRVGERGPLDGVVAGRYGSAVVGSGSVVG
jgi:hypothetical protein